MAGYHGLAKLKDIRTKVPGSTADNGLGAGVSSGTGAAGSVGVTVERTAAWIPSWTRLSTISKIPATDWVTAEFTDSVTALSNIAWS